MGPTVLRWRRARLAASAVAAVCASAVLLAVRKASLGGAPPLGPAFNPGHGARDSAAGAESPRSQALALPGRAGPPSDRFGLRLRPRP